MLDGKEFKKGVSCSIEEYTFKELGYILFRRKKCPLCGCKLQKNVEKVYEGRGIESIGGLGMYHPRLKFTAKKYLLVRYYYCSHCNKKYRVSELVGL